MATRVCPQCGSQYVASVRRCIDCEVPLVDEAAEPRPESQAGGGGDGADRDGQLVYELEGWGGQLKVALEGMLDNAGVARVWEAGALVVPASFEAQVDELIEVVEGGEVEVPDDGVPQVAFEIEGLSSDEMVDLEARLVAAHVDHGWSEEGELVVGESDEDEVSAIITELLSEDPDDLDGGLATHEVLSALFVAVDKLRKDVGDAKLIDRFRAAAEQLGDVGVPYGMSGEGWSDLKAQAEDLLGALDVDIDDADLEASLASHQRRSAQSAVEGAEDGPVDADGGAIDRVDLARAMADALRERLVRLV